METALITGGTAGLGRALAAALVERGWRVVLDGRDAAAIEATAAELGSAVTAVAGDVTVPEHRRDLMARVAATGRLDVLVNNASTLGASPLPPLDELPLDVFRHVLEVNVVAPLALTQLAIPLLRSSGGVIVNITSDAAVEAYPTWGGYGSSKAALEQLIAVLAAEQPDLPIWAFDPGDMRTRMHQEAFPGEDISDRPEPATVVPALLHLLDHRPPSGRVRAADLAVGGAR